MAWKFLLELMTNEGEIAVQQALGEGLSVVACSSIAKVEVFDAHKILLLTEQKRISNSL